jgi:hypothetical protein
MSNDRVMQVIPRPRPTRNVSRPDSRPAADAMGGRESVQLAGAP